MYQDIVPGYNDAVGLHISNILKILNSLTPYTEGDFTPVLEKMPGKQVLANEKLDLLIGNILSLIDDCYLLIQAVVEGRLTPGQMYQNTREITGGSLRVSILFVANMSRIADSISGEMTKF